jgi:Zn-dependent oligopeptidase
VILVDVQDEFFPRWDEVKAEHVKPGILHIIGKLEEELTELEGKVQPTWEGLVEPVERIADRIGRAWSTVSHLKVMIPRSPITRFVLDAALMRSYSCLMTPVI